MLRLRRSHRIDPVQIRANRGTRTSDGFQRLIQRNIHLPHQSGDRFISF
jgi:hypothetical protein